MTVPAAKFVKHEIEMNSLDKPETEEQVVKIAEAVEEKTVKVEYGMMTRRLHITFAQAGQRTYRTTKCQALRPTTPQRLPMSRIALLLYSSPKEKEQASPYSPLSELPQASDVPAKPLSVRPQSSATRERKVLEGL